MKITNKNYKQKDNSWPPQWLAAAGVESLLYKALSMWSEKSVLAVSGIIGKVLWLDGSRLAPGSVSRRSLLEWKPS